MRDKGLVLPVLIADDSEDDCRLLARAFKEAGVPNPLHFAQDGQAALDLMRSWPPEKGPRPGLLLLDLRMPRLDGHQTLRAIRAEPRLALMPVLVMSTSDYSRDVLECYKMGANAVLLKPFEYVEFVELVSFMARFWLGHALLPEQYAAYRNATGPLGA